MLQKKCKSPVNARHTLIVASAIALRVLVGAAAIASPPVTSPVGQSPREFTFVAAGDMLGPYHSNLKLDDPSFAKVVAIVRGADAAFANEEGSTFELATFAGWMEPETLGSQLPPHSLATARIFKEMGFDLLSRANNHSIDWGIEGMLLSDQMLDAIGFVHAGTGRSLEAARAPGYWQSGKGRVSLIASASSFAPNAPAGDIRRTGPRPGINPLRVRESDKRVGTYDVSVKDRSAIIRSIATARQAANFVVYSIHAHEGCWGGEAVKDADDAQPCDFLIPLFHDIVDAGADVVVRSGPRIVQGIEIYHGKPIFYGLGSLFYELPRSMVVPQEGWEDYVENHPADNYESAIASTEFRNGVISKIIIYPLVIEAQESSADFGIPKVAQGADARRILARIQKRSSLLGTKLEIVNDIGFVNVTGVR